MGKFDVTKSSGNDTKKEPKLVHIKDLHLNPVYLSHTEPNTGSGNTGQCNAWQDGKRQTTSNQRAVFMTSASKSGELCNMKQQKKRRKKENKNKRKLNFVNISNFRSDFDLLQILAQNYIFCMISI